MSAAHNPSGDVPAQPAGGVPVFQHPPQPSAPQAPGGNVPVQHTNPPPVPPPPPGGPAKVEPNPKGSNSPLRRGELGVVESYEK